MIQAELELGLYCYLNEPISDRQYPLRIGSFTPLLEDNMVGTMFVGII
jgi:hypothetical protein